MMSGEAKISQSEFQFVFQKLTDLRIAFLVLLGNQSGYGSNHFFTRRVKDLLEIIGQLFFFLIGNIGQALRIKWQIHL